MRLYSNQTKDKSLVGDTTLFTVFNTIHSRLYDDKLAVEFCPGHPDDTWKVDMLSPVYKYDMYKVHKEQIDNDWNFFTEFWGAGWLDLTTWDPEKKMMLPSVIDNATFLVDPNCTLINGDARGLGAARFWGREIALNKPFMRSKPYYENFESLTDGLDFASLQYQNKQFRNSAQNLATPATTPAYDNADIPLIEWWTMFDGKKWMVTTDLKFTKIVRTLEWGYDKWGLAHRKLFPIPGDPFGVSIPDLVEDKQRARSILTNLGLMHAKSDLYPMRLYDRNAVSPTQDLSFGFNKWIPVDGNPSESVQMLPNQPIGQIVSYIMDTIDQAAQRATGATSIQQGVQSDAPRSANEVVRAYNSGDARITTSAKVYGWSEREVVEWWLRQYNKYFSAAHEKIIRIDGPFGPKFKTITGEVFDLTEDPDLYICSTANAEADKQQKTNGITAFSNMVAQDQSVNRRYLNKKGAKYVGGFDSDEVALLYPDTADEIKAKQENWSLDENKFTKIDINDDHQTHIQIHMGATTTHAQIVHIEAHKAAILKQREQQLLQQQAQGSQQMQPGSMPTSMQTMQNGQGQGSAPAASATPTQTVQQ